MTERNIELVIGFRSWGAIETEFSDSYDHKIIHTVNSVPVFSYLQGDSRFKSFKVNMVCNHNGKYGYHLYYEQNIMVLYLYLPFEALKYYSQNDSELISVFIGDFNLEGDYSETNTIRFENAKLLQEQDPKKWEAIIDKTSKRVSS